jgi:hypothetical protein
MPEVTQVKASIPKDLKRQAFAIFALQDEKFQQWLEQRLRAFVEESDALEQYHRERLASKELVGTGKGHHAE